MREAWRRDRVAAQAEWLTGAAAVIGQALLAVVLGGVAGGIAAPQYGAVVGAVGLAFGLGAGYGLSNFVALLVTPLLLAHLAKRPADRKPDDGFFLYRLTLMAVNAMLYVAAIVCAVIVVLLHDGVGFWRSLGCFAVAAFCVSLLTRRAREHVE